MALFWLNRDRDDFTTSFFRLSIFNILSNLMVPLAGLLDVAFLGHLDSIHYLAGVALASVLFNYIYWTFGFLRMGTTGMTAQAVGRGDAQGVLRVAVRNGAIALLVGLSILVLQHPLRELGFALLSATDAVKDSGRAYYNSLIWGAPAALLNFVVMGWFLGRGQGHNVLILSVVSNGVNSLLNYCFILQWGWASAGAGAATALSQYAMLGVGLGLVRREMQRWNDKPQRVSWSVLTDLWDASDLKATFLLNGNIIIRTFALVSVFAVFTNLSAAMGTVVLATNTLLLQVVMLAAHFVDGVAFATESYAGLFQGRGQSDKLRALVKLAAMVSLVMGVAIALLFTIFPTPLFSLLTRHVNVVDTARQSVWWLVPVLALGSQAYMLDGYFLGLTAGKALQQAAVVSALLGFAPVGAIAWWQQSPHLLWLALTLFMGARTLTLALRLAPTFVDTPAHGDKPANTARHSS